MLEKQSTKANSPDSKIIELRNPEGSRNQPGFRPGFLHDGLQVGEELVIEEGADQHFKQCHLKKKPRLGQLFIWLGTINEELLDLALRHQKKAGLRLGEALVELNLVSEEVMRQTLGEQLNVPFINPGDVTVDPSLSRLINRNYAQRHRIVPIGKYERTVTLIMDDPANQQLVEELRAITGFNYDIVTSTRAGLLDAFSRVYEQAQEMSGASRLELLHESDCVARKDSIYLESHELRRADTLVTRLIGVGLKHGISDMHIESADHRLEIRFRIDGVLQDLYLGSLGDELNRLSREVVSRIKILANLDIAERRRPQDGSFRARIRRAGQEVKIDFRVSIVPGYFGENVVLRVLDSSKAPKSIDELGFSARINKTFHGLLKRNTGILLVTGPTGSGKSTTLYGALMTCYRPGIKILTAEDPIEYVYEKITQCEVNPKIGNTFAKYIRAFLRQDPEIVMVGEIRDSETAEMAFRAAQTGHLVLSTLHTNDAIGSVTRLFDLDVDPSLIASCLLGVVSQRLVRRVCPNCKRPYQPSADLLREFFDDAPPDLQWVKGKGCARCNHTGYNGRLAIAELWTPGEEDIILINKKKDIDDLRKTSCRNTLSMAEDALEKLRAGATNLEELVRTLPFSNISRFRQAAGHLQGSEQLPPPCSTELKSRFIHR